METIQKTLLEPVRTKSERILAVVRALREDGRKSLAQLSRELGIPVSTLCEYMRVVRKHYAFTIVPKDEIGLAEILLLKHQAAEPALQNEERLVVVENDI